MDELWDNLIDAGIATEDELVLVINLNGGREDVLEDVLFVRTGYRSWDQFEGDSE